MTMSELRENILTGIAAQLLADLRAQLAENDRLRTLFNEVFVDQLISDGRVIKIGGGELEADGHYIVAILDKEGEILSRATGYDLAQVFIEAFQATPPRVREDSNG
jgi:hypothetical protein